MGKSSIPTQRFKTFSAFLRFMEQKMMDKHGIIFRGQASAEWQLKTSMQRFAEVVQPKLNRPHATVKRIQTTVLPIGFQEFIASIDVEESGELHALVDEYLAEFRKLSRVHQDHLMGSVESRLKTLDKPAEILRYFENLRRLESEVYSLMRHYGCPTPFLDFTDSPFTAAYFAFEPLLPDATETSQVAVYALEPGSLGFVLSDTRGFFRDYLTSREECSDVIVRRIEKEFPNPLDRHKFIEELYHFALYWPSRRLNKRARNQAASMVYLPRESSLEELHARLCNFTNGAFMRKYLIPYSERARALLWLKRVNVHPSSIYSGMEGAAKFAQLAMEFPSYSGKHGYGQPAPGSLPVP